MEMNKVFIKGKVSLLALLMAPLGSSLALDESRLWLPSNYESLYLDLKAAAQKAELLDRCVTVMRGTLDLSQSSTVHPIYRIMCRQENGRTYNEMVDGLTFDTLTTVVPVVIALTDEEREAQRLEEERREQEVLERQKQSYLSECLAVLDEKTKLFIDKKVLREDIEPESFSMDEAKFYIDFDAKDVNGIALEYRAICVVAKEADTKIYIRKRR